MAIRQRDTSLGTGVFYAQGDYVGIRRRFLIILVDSFVLAVMFSGLATVWLGVIGGPPMVFTTATIALFWTYEVVLKRSSWRTVGYRLTGCRIVNLQGQSPSLFALTFRSMLCMLWMLGLFNLPFDLMWCGIDDDRQTLRDRFAETCLINERATPIGAGEIHLAYYDIGILNLYYARVTHPKIADGHPTHQHTSAAL
jgi:uncharacterized RDD family membrane protein YckC